MQTRDVMVKSREASATVFCVHPCTWDEIACKKNKMKENKRPIPYVPAKCKTIRSGICFKTSPRGLKAGGQRASVLDHLLRADTSHSGSAT